MAVYYAQDLCCKCSRCDRYVPGTPEHLKETARWLLEVEIALGGYPLLILSACRCPLCDAEVDEEIPGGNFHQDGLAVDFVCRELSPSQIQRHLVPRQGEGKLIAGLASFRGYSHIQRAPATVMRWRP